MDLLFRTWIKLSTLNNEVIGFWNITHTGNQELPPKDSDMYKYVEYTTTYEDMSENNGPSTIREYSLIIDGDNYGKLDDLSLGCFIDFDTKQLVSPEPDSPNFVFDPGKGKWIAPLITNDLEGIPVTKKWDVQSQSYIEI
jgi:hypothetical protein